MKKPLRDQMCRAVGVFLVLAVLVLASCSNLSNPVASQSIPFHLHALTLSPEVFTPITLDPAHGQATKSLVTTQTISAAGGAIELSGSIPSSGSFAYRVDVPPGALSQDTGISISVPNDNEAVVELLPHGIQFAKPVTFSIRVDVTANPTLSRIDQATLDTYWYNNILEVWQGQSAVVERKGSVITATVGLPHFSRYALGGD